MVECSPATRAARVRFPADALFCKCLNLKLFVRKSDLLPSACPPLQAFFFAKIVSATGKVYETGTFITFLVLVLIVLIIKCIC